MRLIVKGMTLRLGGLERMLRDFKGLGLPRGLDLLWAKDYERFIRKRFLRLSRARGGGEWPPHKHKRKGNPQLLMDTGTLEKSLGIGAPGNLYKRIRSGVKFGIIGAGSHPSGLSIRKLALIHHQGCKARHIPKRTIIVKPDRATLKVMRNDLKRILKTFGVK